MKELNELVELAKKANAAGQGTPEMVDFLVFADPDKILAIAEAFRALEQEREDLQTALRETTKCGFDHMYRAEAAEAALEVEKDTHDDTLQAMHLWCKRAKEAEAKLAEVEEQKSRWVNWAKEGCAEADRLKEKLAEMEGQEPVAIVARRAQRYSGNGQSKEKV